MITSTEDRISTNKLLLDIIDFDKDLFDTSTLSTEEIGYYNSITRGFDKQIQFFIDWLDSDEARRIFYENESYNEKVFEKIDDEIKSIVGDTSLTADEIISHIYDSGLQHGADEIRRTKYYNDATKFGLEFLQDYNFSLISNVNEDLKNHIRAEIFTGIAASESMPEVANRILNATDNSLTGKTLSARQRAMMIARTETARAMTQGRLQSYANYGVREVKILTAGDSACAICREAADKIFPISEAGNLVPFHPLCRCSVMAYIRHGILQRTPNIDAEIMNLTPSNNVNSGQTTLDLYTNYKFKDIKESKKIAKELGYDYQRVNGNEIFTYKFKVNGKSKTIELRFEKELLENLDKNLLSHYSKRDVLLAFKNAPLLLKSSPKRITFTNNIPEKYPNATGYHKNGFCHITPLAFTVPKRSHANLPFTLYHEMAHALDWRMSILGNHGLSKNKNGYLSIIDEDEEYQSDKFDDVLSVSKHALDKGEAEDFAESLAMWSINNFHEKKYAMIELSNGDLVSYSEWKNRFKNRDKYFEDLFENEEEIIEEFKK